MEEVAPFIRTNERPISLHQEGTQSTDEYLIDWFICDIMRLMWCFSIEG
jgi:hypothetical protein